VIVAKIEGRCAVGRFGNMRKVQTFTVYPGKKGDTFVVAQSHRSIVKINVETREGLWNPKGCYLPHLSSAMGAVAVTLPEEFVHRCRQLAGV
jgi:hypothetical protein